MARDDERQAVRPVGSTNGAGGRRRADARRELEVRDRPAVGNGPQLGPHPLLEGAARRVDGKVEGPPPAREILSQLSLETPEERRVAGFGAPDPAPDGSLLRTDHRPLGEVTEHDR